MCVRPSVDVCGSMNEPSWKVTFVPWSSSTTVFHATCDMLCVPVLAVVGGGGLWPCTCTSMRHAL